MTTIAPLDLYWNDRRSLPDVPDADPLAFHRSLPGYAVPPLRAIAIPDAGTVMAKVETNRYGLPSFKILGASWAMRCELVRRFDLPVDVSLADLRHAVADRGLTFVAATDGNHGRAVAHLARLLGQASHILVPDGMAEARQAAIRAEGATIEVVHGSYDDAIARSAAMADDTRLVISDASWPGYETVPADVIAGYSTIFAEIEALTAPDQVPTHLFVQMGVGALGSAAIRAARRWGARVISVEPEHADCILHSLRAGELTEAPGPHTSIMAGLNCGLPSLIAWPTLQAGIDLALTASDDAARTAMRELAENGIVAGETGAAGLAGLLALQAMPDWPAVRDRLGIDAGSRILTVVTEGATDPDAWRSVTGRNLPD